MKLIVNGQDLGITLEGESTVGEVLKAFEAEAAKFEGTTINIKVDGNEIPADRFEEAIKDPINDSTVIELSVVTKKELSDLFKTIALKFDELSSSLKELPVLLQSSKDAEATKIITDFAEAVDAFCHAATLSALFPDLYEKLTIDGKEISGFFEEFAPILKDFEEAFSAKDTVTVGDLAEYEISVRAEAIAATIKSAFN